MLARWRDDSGQTMILVALAAVVLLGALALAVDWGYGLTQRRVMQTTSDAAALAVGRYLATSVLEVGGTPAFIVSELAACEVAEGYVRANRSFAPSGGELRYTLQLGTAEPTVWRDVPTSGGCAGASTVAVPADTRFVRVTSTISYRSLVAGVLGSSTMTAAASARAKLFGTSVPTTGRIWPMVRHYDKSDFDVPCPPNSCDPTDVTPIVFWSSHEEDMVYANLKGMVDLSRDSPTYKKEDGTTVPQLITEWDRSGSPSASPPTPLKTDHSGNCASGWDTAGGESPQNGDKQCSIPNWFYWTFDGRLSLDSNWILATPPGQEAPAILTNRSVCAVGERPELAPSCDDPTVGDWVEVAGGNVGTNESGPMLERIRQSGFHGTFSDRPVDPRKPDGRKFGKALVVLIYLWDCGETFNKTALPSDPEGQWRWTQSGNDCSVVRKTDDPGRVHLFTAAPFTFYEGLVSASEIAGYWGGAFGESRDCHEWKGGEPLCDLTALANSAILVADDGYTGP